MNFDSLRSVFPTELGFMLAITIGGLLLYQLLFFILKKWAVRQKRFIPQLLQQYIYYPGFMLMLVVTLKLDMAFTKRFLSDEFYHLIGHTLVILIITLSAVLMMRIISTVRDILLHHYQQEQPTDFTIRKAKTKFQLIQRVINFLIIIAAISICLLTFDSVRKIGTSLLASAGVVGLIIGFAAQKSLGTLFAGIQIAISQPIRLDDVVVVEGKFGTIGDITLTYAVVNIWDGSRLVVPINYFLEKPFENWTRVSSEVIGKVKLRVDYTLPIDAIRQEFFRCIHASELWDKRNSGFAVTDADDKTMEIRGIMSAKNSSDSNDLECLVREKLITYIQKNYPGCLPTSRIQMNERSDINTTKTGKTGNSINV